MSDATSLKVGSLAYPLGKSHANQENFDSKQNLDATTCSSTSPL
jgi:hypothetical protein